MWHTQQNNAKIYTAYYRVLNFSEYLDLSLNLNISFYEGASLLNSWLREEIKRVSK